MPAARDWQARARGAPCQSGLRRVPVPRPSLLSSHSIKSGAGPVTVIRGQELHDRIASALLTHSRALSPGYRKAGPGRVPVLGSI
eukprot:540168-Hanusia_phi.AAC.1